MRQPSTKQFIFLLAVIQSIVFISCDQSTLQIQDTSSLQVQDTSTLQVQSEPLHGTWNLNKVTAGFSQPEIFTEGQIVWEFNAQKQLLVNINIALSISSNVILKENGDYNFEIIDETMLKIDSTEYNYLIDEDKLIVSFQEASDGPRMEFIRCDKTNQCSNCKAITISNKAFFADTTGIGFRIVEHNITDDCLEVTFEYGGCHETEINLIASEDIAESSPPQRDIRFSFGENGECKMQIRSKVRFNIKNLATADDSIILNIMQHDISIVYE